MTDTTTPEDFASTLSAMVSTALAQAAVDRQTFVSIARLIKTGNAECIAQAQSLARTSAGLDRTPPLAQDSIQCAVSAALPRGEHDAGEQGGMG